MDKWRRIGDIVWYSDEFGNRYVSQIIGHEPDGKVRLFVFPESTGYAKVMYMDPNDIRYPTLRELTGTADWEEEEEMASRNHTQAWNEGFDLAQAMQKLFGQPTPDFASLLVLGKAFAKMSGYGALNDGMQFIEGFSQGFTNRAPKEIEAGE